MLDHRIETFMAVCDLMNYRKAAELLHITQPAVTQHIQFLENEYGCEIRLEPIPYNYIRWVKDPTTDITKLKRVSDVKKVKDMKGNPLLLFANEWVIDQVLSHNEGLELLEFRKN